MVDGRFADSPESVEARGWRSWDPWLRFGLLSLATLIGAAFIPPWTTQQEQTSTSTTTAMQAPASFDFTAETFLDRWNRVGIDPVLTVDRYDQTGPTGNLLQVALPEHQIEWTVLVSVDPSTDLVTQVELLAPVVTSGTNEVGALIVIAAVESLNPADAQVRLNDILDHAEEAAGSSDPVDVSVKGPKATYRYALSEELQFLFQATR